MKQTVKRILLIQGLLVLMIIIPAALAIQAQQESLYNEAYLLPPEDIQDLLNRDRHYDTLNFISPDKNHFMIPVRAPFSSLQLMSQKTYRLGMLEICPDVNREWRLSTAGNIGLKVFSLNQRKIWAIEIPENAFISDMTWSPDGKKIAFLAHLPKGTQVWTADTATGKSKPLNQAYVMATLSGTRGYGRSGNASRMLQWTPSGSIVTLLVPKNRGPEPKESLIPGSPIIRRTRDKATPTPTYPFLLRTPHDKDLFKYYTTSQLVELIPGKAPRKIGTPAMYMNLSVSTNGKYILAEKMTEPFSYIVNYSNFPRELQVLDFEGHILSTVLKTPLRETSSRRAGRD